LAKLVVGGEQAQAPPAVILSDEDVSQGETTEESKDPYEHDNLGAAKGRPHERITPIEHTLTRTGVAMGTAGYMSPEQVRGDNLDARTDIFSFGLVLYEMATGQRAFTGETAAMLKEAILNRTLVPVHELNMKVPQKLVAIIDNATEKNREHRYQSATEMRADLEMVKHGMPQQSQLRRWRLFAGTGALLVSLITGGFYWWRSHKAAKLTSTDTVVLADFTNNTSDPVFDTALNPALEVELGQTPFLDLLSEEKVRGALRLMGRREDERLTPQLTREVCERTKSRALLAGSISDVGNEYQIELKSIDCKTGKALADSRAKAEERNEIVRRLGEAGYSLREKLGEPASLLREFNASPDAAASPSVEALQAYAAGAATFGKLEAVSHFKHAGELDPGFALAYGWLARCYDNLYQDDHLFEELTKAYHLPERVSRRDRLYIEALYYSNVTGEAEKAISTLQQAIQLFPRWGQPRIEFSWQLRMLGQYENSAAVARDAQRLMPGNMSSYGNLSPSYIALDRLVDARLVLEQEKARVPDNWNMHQYFYRLAFLQNDRNGIGRTGTLGDRQARD
jgi:hypothetical protein